MPASARSTQNPWKALPFQAPFVLAEDRLAVDVYNRDAPKQARIDLRLLPEPFTGRVDAPVVLLALNPGVGPEDHAAHRRPEFQKMVRRCLALEDAEFPFYHLAPHETGPGARWWRRVARPLVEAAGLEQVARGLLCVEYFPYHSVSFGHATLRLPSQAFSFELVRSAMAREAVVILMRGKRSWLGAVPELADYGRFYELQNPRNVILSPSNAGPAFEAAVESLGRFGRRARRSFATNGRARRAASGA